MQNSKKKCQNKKLDGYEFCIKHILEDPKAPFRQCEFIIKTKKKKMKQCLTAIPISKDESELTKYIFLFLFIFF